MPFFNTVPGLVPLKIYSGNTLLTTNVNLINFTGSGVTTTVNAFNGLTVNIGGGGTTVNTGSLLKTASFSNPNLTFTKGDGSTFNVNLSTLVLTSASYALSSSYALSASYAPNNSTGSFTGSFTGSLLGTASFASTASYINPLTQSVLISGSLTVETITASVYSGLPNNYLYVNRNTTQSIITGGWADQDVIFNNSVYAVGIPYAVGSGVASLTGNKVYRITARLAWSATSTYLFQYSCFDTGNIQIGPTVEIVQSTNGSNNISDYTLDFIYAPLVNTDIKIRMTNNTTALTGEYIRGDLNTQMIIQQIA
jgi:hypothetical protein